MPALHDYVCSKCQYRENDRIAGLVCPHCETEMQITFDGWKSMEIDPRHDERCDSKGFVKRFSVKDDPLCLANIGLGSPQLQSYNKLSEDEQKVFQERLIANGDSPKLRREILAKYNEKVGTKYELQD